jgi:hypothetical protein
MQQQYRRAGASDPREDRRIAGRDVPLFKSLEHFSKTRVIG